MGRRFRNQGLGLSLRLGIRLGHRDEAQLGPVKGDDGGPVRAWPCLGFCLCLCLGSSSGSCLEHSGQLDFADLQRLDVRIEIALEYLQQMVHG